MIYDPTKNDFLNIVGLHLDWVKETPAPLHMYIVCTCVISLIIRLCVILYFSSEWLVIHWPKMSAVCTCSCRMKLWIKPTPLPKLDKPERVWTPHIFKKRPTSNKTGLIHSKLKQNLSINCRASKNTYLMQTDSDNKKRNVTSNYS